MTNGRLRRGSIPAVLAVVALALGAGRARAQEFGQNKVQYRTYDWRSVTSDHFQVYFDKGQDSLGLRVLDLAEKAHAFLATRMGHPLSHRVPIIVYGSHNDFAQTNVTPELIDEATGGFTELLRNRVVLPFAGSYEDLRHVVVHELTHAVMFDQLYGGSASAMLAHQTFFSVPLWFAEGLAEYNSLGMESNAEMFLRDGTLEGYLPPLEYSGGYIVYKQGQSALSYLVDRYGEDRLRDILRRTRQMHSFERAFQRSVGMTVGKFDQQWREWLKRRYWPTVATQQDPELFARRLTDHRRDQSSLNTAPAVSPQGDRIAYFSDRRQYTDAYVMSAYDGKVLKRIIRGERDVHFESIPLFRSAIAWSPDGGRLALTAHSAGHDVLYVMSSRTGKVQARYELPCDALQFPAWSPVADSVVVVGIKGGQSDLYLVDLKRRAVTRLTHDTWDEKEPTWTVDGRAITFASDRLAPVVLEPVRKRGGFGSYAIYDLDLASGRISLRLDTSGDDHDPAWSPDGRKLAFITDRGGTPNIVLYDTTAHSFTQLTQVSGGVSSVSWSRLDDRLVFSAFNRGGFDVFAVKQPVSLDPVLARLRRETPGAVFDEAEALDAPEDSTPPPPGRGALAGGWPDTFAVSHDTVRVATARDTAADRSAAPVALAARRPGPGPGPWGDGQSRPFPVVPDTLPSLPVRAPLVERGGEFALPDSVLDQKPRTYHPKLTPDFYGADVAAATGFGFAGSTQLNFSDFLGNHNVFVAADLYGGSLEETNALLLYTYLPRRVDVSVGAFHFKNYYSAGITPLGEQLGTPELFSEQTFGGVVGGSLPFDRFHRVELDLIGMAVDRKFFVEDAIGNFDQVGRQYRSVLSPTLSLIGDNVLWGEYGPVNGDRYNATYGPSFAVLPHGLAYQTLTFDGRRYWDLTHGYTWAERLLLGRSTGRDAQTLQVGGFSTLRGYDAHALELQGTRIAVLNSELRFPFIQHLGLVGPLPIGVFNLHGVVFGDAGVVWSEGDQVRLSHTVDGKRRLDFLKIGYGTGIRTSFGFAILKLDIGWSTDLAGSSRPRYQFSIGPEF